MTPVAVTAMDALARAREAYDRCVWRDQLSLLEPDWQHGTLKVEGCESSVSVSDRPVRAA